MFTLRTFFSCFCSFYFAVAFSNVVIAQSSGAAPLTEEFGSSVVKTINANVADDSITFSWTAFPSKKTDRYGDRMSFEEFFISLVDPSTNRLTTKHKTYSRNASSYTLSSLSPGSYKFKLRATYENSDDSADYLADMTLTVTVPVPGKVGNLSLGDSEGTYDTDGRIDVSWSAITHAAKYQIRYGKSGSSKTTVDRSSTSRSFTGLSDGVWEFETRACNNINQCGSWSNKASKDVRLPPGIPTNFKVSENPSYDGTYSISWSKPSGVVNTYEWRTRINSGSWSGVTSQTSTAKSFTKTSQATYRYQVRACRSGGICSGFTSEASTVVDFPTPVKVGALTLGDSEGTYDTDGRIDLSWSAITNATKYQVRYGKSGSSKTTVDNSSTSRSISSLGDGVWEFETRACNRVNECGTWSNVYSKEVRLIPGVPTNFKVSENPSNDGTYSISWSKPSGVVNTYEWRTRTNSGSWSGVTSQTGTSKPFTKTSQATYRYQVRACRSGGICSGFTGEISTVVDFNVPAKVGNLTLGDSEGTYDTDGRIDVSWPAVSGTKNYEVRYGIGSSKNTITTGSTSRSFTNLDDGVWGFDVRACNMANECGSWSNLASKDVRLLPGVPTNFNVSENPSNDGSYSISWNKPSGVVNTYEWRVRTNSGSWSGVTSQVATSKSFSSVAQATYGYQVRACRSGNVCSAFTNEVSTLVDYIKPAKVGAITLGDSEGTYDTDGRIDLNWSAITHATRYDIRYGKSGTTKTTLDNTGVSRSITNLGDGTWQFEARACNPANECGAWSNVYTKEVRLTPGVPTNFKISENPSNDGTYSISWSKPSGVVNAYEWRTRINTGDWSNVTSQTGTSKAFTQTTQATYRYQVRACRTGGICSGFTNEVTTVVDFPTPAKVTGVTLGDSEGEIDTNRRIDLSWSAVSGASVYEIRYGNTGESKSTIGQSETSRSFTELNLGMWEFEVRACNIADECGSWSGLSSKQVGLIPTESAVLRDEFNSSLIANTVHGTVEGSSITFHWTEFPSSRTSREGHSIRWEEFVISVEDPVTHFKRQIFKTSDRAASSYEYSGKPGEHHFHFRATYEDSDDSFEYIGSMSLTIDSSDQLFPKVEPIVQGGSNPSNYNLGGDVYHGALAGSHSVGRDGSFSYSVPIAIAPGINGTQPSLALEYNSSANNGYVGYGWSVSGTGMNVSRCPSDQVRDGFVSGINYDDDFAFCLNGQRLAQLYSGSTEYRTEVESFSRITRYGGSEKSPTYWVVERQNGSKEYYGQHGTLPFRVDGEGYRYIWYLARFEDKHGNYFEYNYETPRTGVHRIKDILYTLNPLQQSLSHRVVFNYETRQDQLSTYEAGALNLIDERLVSIDSSNGQQYRLEYLSVGDSIDPTRISRLHKIDRCLGTSDKCQEPITFEWNDNSADKLIADVSGLKYFPVGESGFSWADTLGATFPFSSNEDIANSFYAGEVIFGQHSDSTILAMGENAPRSPASAGYRTLNEGAVRGDFDGDNKQEIVWYEIERGHGSRPDLCDYYVSMNASTAGTRFASNIECDPKSKVTGLDAHDRVSGHVMDVNGDGLDDFYLTSPFLTNGIKFYLSTGNTLIESQSYSVDESDLGVEAVHPDGGSTTRYRYYYAFEDFNGDGLVDLLRAAPAIRNGESVRTILGVGRNDISIALNSGNGFSNFVRWGDADDYKTVTNAILNRGMGISSTRDFAPRIADVNGDGLPDILGFMQDVGIEVGINTGSSFDYQNDWAGWTTPNPSNSGGDVVNGYECLTSPGTMLFNYSHQLAQYGDVNGDGLTDIVFVDHDGMKVSLSTGSSFTDPQLWSTDVNLELTLCGKRAADNINTSQASRGVPFWSRNVWKLADFNQDGKADVGIQKLRDEDSVDSPLEENYDRYEIQFSLGGLQSNGRGFSNLVRVYSNPYYSRPVWVGGPAVHLLDFQVSDSGVPFIVDGFKRAPDLSPWTILRKEIVADQNETRFGETNSLLHNWASYKSGIEHNHIKEVLDGRGVKTTIELQSINRNPSLYIQDSPRTEKANFSQRARTTTVSADARKSIPANSYDSSKTAFSVFANVVKNIRVQIDKDTIQEISDYRYKNHLNHKLGFGGLGFEVVEKTEFRPLYSEKIRLVTNYLQEFNEEGSGRYVLSKPYLETTCVIPVADVFGCYFSGSRIVEETKKNWQVKSLGDNDVVRYFPYLLEEESKQFDLDTGELISKRYIGLKDLSVGDPCPKVQLKSKHNRIINYDAHHDAYGVPLVSSEINCDTYGESGSRTESINIDNNIDDWLLGLVHDSIVTSWVREEHNNYENVIVRHTKYSFDSKGRIETKIQEPDGKGDIWFQEGFKYDDYGLVKTYEESVKSFLNDGVDFTKRVTTTANTYSASGLLTHAVTNPLGHQVTTKFHERWGVPIETIDPNGLKSVTHYDGFGRPYSARVYGGFGVSTQFQYRKVEPGIFGYNEKAEFYIAEKTDGQSTSFLFFDELGREVGASSINFNGDRVYVGKRYTHHGWLKEETQPYISIDGQDGEGARTSYNYDVLGRVIETRFPGGAVQTTDYSSNNGVFTVTHTDSNKHSTVRSYDAMEREKSVRDPLGSIVNYSHNALGNVVSTEVEDENGNNSITHTVDFDILGRKTSLIDPDLGRVNYSYNAFGHLIAQTNGEKERICYEFDKLDRQVRRIDGGINACGLVVHRWIYDQRDKLGLLSEVSGFDTNGQPHNEIYTYTSRNLLSSLSTTINGETFNLTNHYDAYDRLMGMTYPGNFTTQNHYNSFGYLESVSNAHTFDVLYEVNDVDKWGNSIDLSYGNGMDVISHFNEQTGLLNSRRAFYGIHTAQDQTFEFDDEGNLRERYDARVSVRQNFCYDPLYRLTHQVINSSCTDDNGTYSGSQYAYDIHGNILRKDEISDYQYGEAASNAGPHAVSFAKGHRYRYDNAGRMINGKGRSIEYSAFGKPTLMASSNYRTEINYGALQQRIQRVDTEGGDVTTTTYLGKLYERIDTSNSREHRFYMGDWGIHVINESHEEEYNVYLTRDHIGSVVSKTDDLDSTAPIVKHLANESWGRRQNQHWGEEVFDQLIGSALDDVTYGTTRGFTDHEHLDGVGLIHMNGRVYDPVIGRFVSPDPLIQDPENTQSFNRYSYVWNNPLKYTDPTGESVCYTHDGNSFTCPVSGSMQSSDNISKKTHAIYKVTNLQTNEVEYVAVPLSRPDGSTHTEDELKALASVIYTSRWFFSDLLNTASNLDAEMVEDASGSSINFRPMSINEYNLLLDASGWNGALDEAMGPLDLVASVYSVAALTYSGVRGIVVGGPKMAKGLYESLVKLFSSGAGKTVTKGVLSKGERLKLFNQALTDAPAAKNADEALKLINRIMDKIEDAYSGVAAEANPGLKYKGRMYGPRSDYTTRLPDGGLEAITKGNIIRMSPSGGIQFFLKNSDGSVGKMVFNKAGGG